MSVTIPTAARLMSDAEYRIVTRVCGDTLPYRFRIIVTNGAGMSNRPFTIPTSLISTLLGTAATGFAGAIAGYVTSFINVGYVMNVGTAYSDMSTSNTDLLVHETMHVWQGKNSSLALSYVFNSCISQCLRGGGAYSYTAGKPWSSYNVEQQASIVEHWFLAGEPTSGDLWPYVRDYVRKGIA
ncbi:MAG: hypothetical protein EKK71_11885 [Candidatus Competibacteraceae bacterium]|nr:MAG: hypothetical protein EKK71_11885 [Candidatus Competibacteraceae bacterium]